MQRRPDHRDGEEAFKIPRSVPVHHGNGLARAKTLRDQKRPQPGNPFVELPVGPRPTASVNDDLIRIASSRSVQDLPNVQGEVRVHERLFRLQREGSAIKANVHMTKKGAKLRP